MSAQEKIKEFEQLRDSGEIHAGVCQVAIELIAAGLDNDELQAAMARLRASFEQEEANNPGAGTLGQLHFRLPDNEWWPLRWRVLRRDNFTCKYCGRYDPPPEKGAPWRRATLCADHVIPLSRGGTNDEGNLVCACLPCNSSKNDRLLSEWMGRYQ